jgi:predicted acyl esterase
MGDRQAIARRPDALNFTTAPWPKATEIVGSFQANLWVTSSAPSHAGGEPLGDGHIRD